MALKFNDETIQAIFGKEDAENESPERLKEFFIRNKAYENLCADLPIRILVGHKGVGKSALLKTAYARDQEEGVLSLWLRPDDVRRVAPTVEDGGLNARIESWKSALTKLISQEIINSFAAREVDKIEKFTADNRGRIIDIVAVVAKLFSNYTEALLDAAKVKVIKNFEKTNKIHIYLDDLDRGWQEKPEDISNISALLNAIRDICGAKNTLQFRLGLRSDVYFLVRTSDESTDKIEQNIIFLTWENYEILAVAAKRVGSYFGETISDADLMSLPQGRIAQHLHKVIEPIFRGSGKWESAPIHRVLLSLVRSSKTPKRFSEVARRSSTRGI